VGGGGIGGGWRVEGGGGGGWRTPATLPKALSFFFILFSFLFPEITEIKRKTNSFFFSKSYQGCGGPPPSNPPPPSTTLHLPSTYYLYFIYNNLPPHYK